MGLFDNLFGGSKETSSTSSSTSSNYTSTDTTITETNTNYTDASNARGAIAVGDSKFGSVVQTTNSYESPVTLSIGNDAVKAAQNAQTLDALGQSWFSKLGLDPATIQYSMYAILAFFAFRIFVRK